MKTETISRREFADVMAGMKRNGWVHTMTVMDDCGTGGVFFTKNGVEFRWTVETHAEARKHAGMTG